MSENSESAKLTFHVSSSNSTIMASAEVGNGSSWTIANSSRKLQICSCSGGLFHKMGGSKSTGEHHGSNDPASGKT
jgi:hypothetical protein